MNKTYEYKVVILIWTRKEGCCELCFTHSDKVNHYDLCEEMITFIKDIEEVIPCHEGKQGEDVNDYYKVSIKDVIDYIKSEQLWETWDFTYNTNMEVKDSHYIPKKTETNYMSVVIRDLCMTLVFKFDDLSVTTIKKEDIKKDWIEIPSRYSLFFPIGHSPTPNVFHCRGEHFEDFVKNCLYLLESKNTYWFEDVVNHRFYYKVSVNKEWDQDHRLDNPHDELFPTDIHWNDIEVDYDIDSDTDDDFEEEDDFEDDDEL